MTPPAPPTHAQWRRWGVDPSWSRFVDVVGHDGTRRRWHVLERSPEAPRATIVCVHGNPTWSYLWRSVLATSGDRYRVIAVDQLGMGYSERTALRSYATRVRDLGDVMEALGVTGPVVLVGHDWGGAVVMGRAVGGLDELVGMVLVNTGIAVPAGRTAPWLIRLAASGPVTDLVGRRTRTFVDGTLGLSWSRLSREARDAYRAPYRSAADRRAIAEFVADVPFDDSHPSAAALAVVADGLASVTVPTLLAWGAADPVFDDSFALDLAARLPHADRQRYAGIGHLAPEETDVAATVDAWLRARLEAPTGPPPERVTDPAGESFTPTWAALEQRRADPAPAFVDGVTGAAASFAELHATVTGIARGLAALGLRPGDRVALLTPPGVDLVAAVYGVWRAGGVTVIADRGLGLRRLGRAVRGAHVDWVIGPPKALAAARVLRWAPRARTIAVGASARPGAVTTLAALAGSTGPLPPAPGPDDPAAVLWTSGATGPAKGVRYRHGQLAAQRDALARAYAITAADRLVAAFAPFALYGPALGITSTIPDVDVTAPGTLTAAALGAACAAIDATIVFASPAALANVIATAGGPDPAFAPVRLVLSAGAPVPVATLREAGRRFPAAELHTPYGMTECLPVADISLAEIDRAADGRGVCVGPPVTGARVTVAPLGFSADRPVTELDPGVTGEVLVRAPWCSDGYDQLWRTQRDARPRGTDGQEWHRTGDVGHLDAAGRLWIEGRSVHVIHHDHGPVTPVPVEVAVERLQGVRKAAAVGVGPVGRAQLVVVVEDAAAPAGLADADLADRVRAAVGPPVAAVLRVPSLPVDIRHNTKIDRAAVARWADAVLAGERAAPRW